MRSNSKKFFGAIVTAALLATLATGARADDPAITLDPGASMRARIDSAVARAATGGTFSVVEVNGDFMRYRARVNSLITFLERRTEESKRQIVSLSAERSVKERRRTEDQQRLDRLLARMEGAACGGAEMKSLKKITDDLATETNAYKESILQIDRQVTDYNTSTDAAAHDIRYLTPFGQINEQTTGKERPVIDRLTFKNGNNTYFDGTMNIEWDILAALREARNGFAENVQLAKIVARRNITAAYLKHRNELGDLGTQKQHALLAALAVIDNSYEAWTRAGVNASLDLIECGVEGKTPAGALFVAVTKATEAILVYKLTGQQAWSNFDVDQLEAHYLANKNVDVDPAWLMLSTKSWFYQQLAKVPNTMAGEAIQGTLEVKEEVIKASMAALKETEKQALEAMETEALRRAERFLAEEGLEATRAAFMAEAGKPNKAQLLRTMYAEIVRLRGVNSEPAKALLQAAKITYMREIAGVTNGTIDGAKLRALSQIINEQRAAVRAAEEALEASTDAMRGLQKAGEEARDTIAKIGIRDIIKNPEALKEVLKKGGIGALKGFAWDMARSAAQTVLDEYYGANWINFYKAYMEVDVVIQELKLLNKKWKDDYENLRTVEKELSDAIVLRDTAERFYSRYLSKLQGTEGLHVAINEIPRDLKGGFTAEVKGTGALYGHVLTLRGDAGYVDLEPAPALPSYDTIGDPQVREAVEQSGRNDTFTYKTPEGFALRNICAAARQQGNAGGKCDIRVQVAYK